MLTTTFKGRRAATIENDILRVTVLHGGGHIAEVFDKRAGVSPLWIPHWRSMEPGAFDPKKNSEFGTGPDGKLLACIMGHNLCLDLFGGPSASEEAAGITAHGEGSVGLYEIEEEPARLVMRLDLPLAQLRLTRSIELVGQDVRVHERIENATAFDRPIGWTQHVTLAPPFLDPETTEFRASVTRSKVFEGDFGVKDYLVGGAEFDWPLAPQRDGGMANLRRMSGPGPASAYTAHLADPLREDAYFVTYSPQCRLAFGYIWKRSNFPWLGIWEENRSRLESPWRGQGVVRGMEFGASPFPESRREMVDRGRLFDIATCRWIPAKGMLEAEYWIASRVATAIPESLAWPEKVLTEV